MGRPLSTGNLFVLPLIVAASFLTVAAGFHVAPAAAMVAAVVEEEPGAIRRVTFAHVAQVARGKEICRRLGN